MDGKASPRFGAVERGGVLKLVGILLLMGGLLFWPAGTLDWPAAWWMVASFLLGILASLLYLWRANPEIFAARARVAADTERWDYVFVALAMLGFFGVLPVAGFDHRFGWSQTPVGVIVLGDLMILLGTAVTAWAQGVNRHFEPTVRIQSDRGHRVVDTGPYAIVRHPGYIAGSVMIAGMALGLGSLWALLPALGAAATLIGRTIFEERTLRAGLPGYADYMTRVRFRWLPGLW